MNDALTLGTLLANARRRLSDVGIDTAAIDARLLVEAATGASRLDLLAATDRPVAADAAARLDDWISRRAAGEPVGRILGTASFYGLDFALGPDTLEPRPDTEVLVEVALGAVRTGRIPGVSPDGAGLRLLDLGTGSGAIAVTLLAKLPGAHGVATDLSSGALDVAKDNAGRNGVADRLDFALGDFFAAVDGSFNLIVSNPPYIASDVIAGLDREVRLHDPRLALDGGPDGLDAYRSILASIGDHLARGGFLAVEIGWDQGEAVGALFRTTGLMEIEVHRDLGGRDRVVLGRRSAQFD
ncbi:peptide chain release factor N(5)-glutamine methyltransferase [Pleomorphomonas diazotrophica]|uniref:Release factor glutamine methyltransferase n=1 Tax=Pleomorphomonas diazotrophica TaxID=1166257 RepID=A0A1I4RIF9_9HYPH|nr:peptide chain release factor N(5)-glutamine methyltransferase [Pleomorphomonas diazotrophica]PKR87547.1 peptide chain release factor N(5)-glutamine methyltransferase [Pleomorphomonas diazotrophica]SFM52062.1 [protein release factor]-glutamine N5-methyltransferase [Pleomorphomonas diazotrophica]